MIVQNMMGRVGVNRPTSWEYSTGKRWGNIVHDRWGRRAGRAKDCVGGDVASGWANRDDFGVYDGRGVARSSVVIGRGYGVVYVGGNVIDWWCECVGSVVFVVGGWIRDMPVRRIGGGYAVGLSGDGVGDGVLMDGGVGECVGGVGGKRIWRRNGVGRIVDGAKLGGSDCGDGSGRRVDVGGGIFVTG